MEAETASFPSCDKRRKSEERVMQQHRGTDSLPEQGRHRLSDAATIPNRFNQEHAIISHTFFLLYSCCMCIACMDCSAKCTNIAKNGV